MGISLTPAYNHHVDDYEAFMSGSIPTSDYHLTLRVLVPGNRLPTINTPSRLSSTSPDAGPQGGIFCAVKYIFHIKGLKTLKEPARNCGALSKRGRVIAWRDENDCAYLGRAER